jgi:hypothetical protein
MAYPVLLLIHISIIVGYGSCPVSVGLLLASNVSAAAAISRLVVSGAP